MASASDVGGKKTATSKDHMRKKRPALADVTNQTHVSQTQSDSRTAVFSSKPMVPCLAKIAKTKNELSFCDPAADFSRPTLPESFSSKSTISVPSSRLSASFQGGSKLRVGSVCFDPLNSRELERIFDQEVSVVSSTDAMRSSRFGVATSVNRSGSNSQKDEFVEVEIADKVVDIESSSGPLFSPPIISDIYKYLRASEANNRPSVDYMERIQIDMNASMRAMLIDWLVEVAEEYRLLGDTLFLAVNYIDRYLSGTVMKRQRLQLLGVACMMIAAKYEEISAPHVEEFCYITDNTYFKKEILQMESAVLNYLKFEMTAPTAICFLRAFVSVAQRTTTSEVSSIQLECTANYITELSLLEYGMIRYSPSLIAASATFLAKYILCPLKKPWNSTLTSYTFYQTSDLCDCVKALHHLYRRGGGSSLPAIRDKYSHHKFKFVAKKYCPLSIPSEFFEDV